MTREEQIEILLEKILETGCDPAEVCNETPELLPELLRKLRQIQSVEQQIQRFFPDSDPIGASFANSQWALQLPSIPGYEVLSVLGSGGMGVVYKATHLRLNRTVAIKMLRAGQFASSAELSRFAREFQVIAQLDCPHIVQIHDVGDSDGRPFFTMEYVEGGTLSDRLRGKPKPAREAAELMIVIAEAIESAHVRGIIHRDLKPANILTTLKGCPKIADFGLAHRIASETSITLSGMRLGTPSYMAPEQALGMHESLGPAVDIYSLGAILYELLTGRPPFRAESPLETQRQVIHSEPIPPSKINSNVPKDLNTICLKCLDKNPQKRYASARALSDDLNRFLVHKPILARPTGLGERSIRWTRRNPTLSALGAMAVALLLLSCIFAIREYGSIQRQRVEIDKWSQRLEFVNRLEREGRYTEAKGILTNASDSGVPELQSRIAAAESDLQYAERLQSIRLTRGKFVIGGGFDYEESSRQYRLLFRQAAMEVDAENVSKVADYIRRSKISAAWIEALDDWAACAQATERDSILKIARLADPDPWRDEVRSQEDWADVEHLENLSKRADILMQPVTLMVAMSTRWRKLGGNPTPFLKRVHRIHPEDFWLNFELGHLLVRSDPSESLAHNAAALSIRPSTAAVHFNLACAYDMLQKTEDARFHFGCAVELDPNHTWALYRYAMATFNLGLREEALPYFNKALEIDPGYLDAKNGLRLAYMQLGRLEDTMEIWSVILKDPNASFNDLDGYAELCLYLNQDAEYDRICQVLLDRFGDTTNIPVCERLSRACLLAPKNGETIRRATEILGRADPGDLPAELQWARPYLLLANSIVRLRENRFDAALELASGEASKVLQSAPGFIRAIALAHLNRIEDSRQELEQASLQLDEAGLPTNREVWMYEILRREATEALMENSEQR